MLGKYTIYNNTISDIVFTEITIPSNGEILIFDTTDIANSKFFIISELLNNSIFNMNICENNLQYRIDGISQECDHFYSFMKIELPVYAMSNLIINKNKFIIDEFNNRLLLLKSDGTISYINLTDI